MPTKNSLPILSIKTITAFWVSAIALLILFGFVFQDILLPFILGAIIAYILNPAVNALETYKIKRAYGSLLIICSFILVLCILGATIFPIIFKEMVVLSNKLPEYSALAWEYVRPVREWLEQRFNISAADNEWFANASKTFSGNAINILNGIFMPVVSSGTFVVNTLSLIFVMPLVAFFMMTEWPKIITWFKNMIPTHQHKTVEGIVTDIDKKVSGFIRGQLLIALILAVIYAIALQIAGLKFGLVIGFMAGLLSIIPLLGSIIGLMVSIIVAWFQSYSIIYTAVIAAIFVGGQLFEGNVLTPKIIGTQVGMHPLWIIFTLMAGAAIMGITGMLIAVPIACIISVMTQFAIKTYKESDFYNAK